VKATLLAGGLGLYVAAILWEEVLFPDLVQLPGAVDLGVRVFLIFLGAAMIVVVFEDEDFRLVNFFVGVPLISTTLLATIGIAVAATIGGLTLPSLSERAEIPIRRVEASSFRPSYTTPRTGEPRSYDPANAIDGDLNTAWIPSWSFGLEDADGCVESDDGRSVMVFRDDLDGAIRDTPGIEWIRLEFAEPAVVRDLAVVAGYARSDGHYTGHNRLRDVAIEIGDAPMTLQLPDTTFETPQIRITVSTDYIEPVSTVTVGVLSVYCGTGHWQSGPIEGGASIAISHLVARGDTRPRPSS
jgi:hypothetical protein